MEYYFVVIIGIIIVVYVIQVIRNLGILQRMVKNSEKVKDIDEVCCICLESLVQPFEEIEQLKCNHIMHVSCLSKWIMTTKNSPLSVYNEVNYQNGTINCPLCRMPLESPD